MIRLWLASLLNNQRTVEGRVVDLLSMSKRVGGGAEKPPKYKHAMPWL